MQPRERGRGGAPVRRKDFSLPVLQNNWGSTIRPRAPKRAGAGAKIAHRPRPDHGDGFVWLINPEEMAHTHAGAPASLHTRIPDHESGG